MNILVTGGCGFIGSNFIRYLLTNPEVPTDVQVVNLDKQTYAGQGRNIEHMGLSNHARYRFVNGDICDKGLVQKILDDSKPNLIFHFAAESHVDRSLQDVSPFRKTNVFGTGILLDNTGLYTRFIHISTDEIYGSIQQGSFNESDLANPSNPYSRSKADAEILAQHYYDVSGLLVIITRSANNYGPYQFSEKFLPRAITELLDGRAIPLMWSEENPGLNVRDWLHVEDNCRAIWYVAMNGQPGKVYNIPGNNERTNIEMARMILEHFNLEEDRIQKIPHRGSHDFRYSIDGSRLKELGFEYKNTDLTQGIIELCEWYRKNQSWWKPLKK